ncbi:MAG: long-chain-fatty-acid--CoA ligase [Nitratireductor sp.]|nr:long-chain-fatty-acid--CoA ligase [Nitratireductor sp.]MCB1459676.1 long-chain-fatty-acid--CoA ligase [Nitratireductor sp.]
MLGLMMDRQLLISALIDHAGKYHGDTEVVSVNTTGGETRTDYSTIRARALKLASAFEKRGMNKSDRIATLAWNNHRHLELYYAISGQGLVCHTINPRLHPDQLVYIATHAGDRILFFDQTFLPIIEGVREKLPGIEAFVLMEPRNAELAARLPWLEFYEDFLNEGDEGHAWPSGLDERDASSLCYTSGTTGNPKGVLYSHRSTLIHAMMSISPDVMNFSARDCLLPVVPMFHVNAWGMAYAAPMVGAKLVLPGPGLDGKSLVNLYNREKVTMSAGVPTIWQGLIAHLEATGEKLPYLQRTVVGGSACPPAMIEKFRKDYDVEVLHAWGMTELSPLGTVNNLKNKHLAQPEADQLQMRLGQGRPPFGIELGIFDDDDNQLPNDGEAQGNLYCRGFWVLNEYFRGDGGDPLHDGWFPTGDVATLDEDGNMVIRDRSKDIIKSGGEWISTVDLENLAVSHPAIAQAAVIAARHPKWDERPLLIVVPKPGASFGEDEMKAFYDGKVAKWWIPDTVVSVDALPLGATGKILKNVLREKYGDALMGN